MSFGDVTQAESFPAGTEVARPSRNVLSFGDIAGPSAERITNARSSLQIAYETRPQAVTLPVTICVPILRHLGFSSVLHCDQFMPPLHVVSDFTLALLGWGHDVRILSSYVNTESPWGRGDALVMRCTRRAAFRWWLGNVVAPQL